ncbi:MAG: hypothetical protein DHS20C18_01240 [Saprospiraceae bacterium]|nr:MAG: hypothetical protein DHS20C18_01240 [Saprospiraceae bacterium]
MQQSSRLVNQINRANEVIDTLKIQLAVRQGENIALVGMQNKLQARIDELEGMNTQAASQQQNLGATIRQKDAEIERLKQLLRDVETIIDVRDQQVEALITTLQNALGHFKSELYSLNFDKGKGTISLNTDELFYSGSTSRIQKTGQEMLAIITQVLSGYPGVFVTVVGHTDNKQPSSSYKDNWNFSALQAAAVVRMLTDEFDMSRNQLIAAGKGEFSPRASNETSEGRKLNRRIELIIEPREENLIRELRKKVREMEMN